MATRVNAPVVEARRHSDAKPGVHSRLEAHAHGLLELQDVILCRRRADLRQTNASIVAESAACANT